MVHRWLAPFALCLPLACSSTSTNDGAGGSTTGGLGGGAGVGTGGSSTGGGSTGGSSAGGSNTGGASGGGACVKGTGGLLYDCAIPQITSLAVDDKDVFFAMAASGGWELHRAPKDGSAAPIGKWADIGAAPSVGDILVDDEFVYVATTNVNIAVTRFDKKTKESTVLVDAVGCTEVSSTAPLAHNALYLFFACNGDLTVRRMEKASGTWKTVDTIGQTVSFTGLAASDAEVFTAMGGVDHCSVGPGCGQVSAAAGYTRVGFAGSDLYALTPAGAAKFASVVTAAADVLVTTNASDFRVDTKGLYALDSAALKGIEFGAGTGKSVPIAGKPGGIALDANFVYWSDQQQSTINRLAR
ncbi:MAG: hypothetical protein IPI67_36390 [Myxococcales bacterium]|nr:hypothetical protein [Myxococcales bacterium]